MSDWTKHKKKIDRRKRNKNRRVKVRNFFRLLFCNYEYKGSNNVFGTGCRDYGYYKLSWGKLSFMLLLIIFLILAI